MNTAKLSNALRKFGEASYELADALLDTPDPVRSGGSEAGTVARPAPALEESPFVPDEFPQPSLADESVAFAPPQQTERDRVLGECPVHQVRWTIKPGGVSAKTGQPYSSFWKCAEKDADGSYCNKKPVKDWIKVHDPEKALAAA